MSSIPIFTVDAFTKSPFKGNPAAVCVFEDPQQVPKDEILQKIALEMNLSETAYVFPLEKLNSNLECNKFRLRWFTPAVEVNLCGHATLATAYVLFTESGKRKGIPVPSSDFISFETLSGTLTVKKLEDGRLQLNFPQGNPVKVTLSNETLSHLEKFFPFERSKLIDIYHCSKTRKLLIELNSPEPILNCKPDYVGLMNIDFGELNVKGIMLTSKPNDSEFKNYDFVSRYFAPWVAINEDPVTGSAHTVLTVYWSKKLNKKRLLAFQVSPRGGELGVELTEDSRVLLEGNAATFLRGEITIPQ